MTFFALSTTFTTEKRHAHRLGVGGSIKESVLQAAQTAKKTSLNVEMIATASSAVVQDACQHSILSQDCLTATPVMTPVDSRTPPACLCQMNSTSLNIIKSRFYKNKKSGSCAHYFWGARASIFPATINSPHITHGECLQFIGREDAA